MDRAALDNAIRSGRRRFDGALAAFDDDAMGDRIDETWTRRDVVAHVEAWERRVVDLLCALRTGDPVPEPVEIDELNERFQVASHDRSLADVRQGERQAYEAMLAAIEGATDEELFDGAHFAWTEGEPLASWFRGNGDEHYDEHLEQLTRPAR